MPLYLLIRRRHHAELDVATDLMARQYAMADRTVQRVETEAGRVVYRKVIDQMPDIDLADIFNSKEGLSSK